MIYSGGAFPPVLIKNIILGGAAPPEIVILFILGVHTLAFLRLSISCRPAQNNRYHP